jgi:SAM-dependent methyltransferase
MKKIEAAVRHCYSTWGESYYDDYYSNKATYPPVHRAIIRRELEAHGAGSLLDAGCGPASILRHLIDLDLELFGFDLTPEMIAECKKVMVNLGVAESNFWEGSVTNLNDFQGALDPPKKFDATVCVGVLPHIPAEHDETVFKNIRASVRNGGLAIVQARNELFSLFTLNRYSSDFFETRLLRKSELQAEIGMEPTLKILNVMKEQFRMDLPPIRKGKNDEPGYDEVLSRTHNPFEVREQFTKAGFRNVKTLFCHYHALPPMLGQSAPEAFKKLSLAMESNPTDWRGHFMASEFLITGIAE